MKDKERCFLFCFFISNTLNVLLFLWELETGNANFSWALKYKEPCHLDTCWMSWTGSAALDQLFSDFYPPLWFFFLHSRKLFEYSDTQVLLESVCTRDCTQSVIHASQAVYHWFYPWTMMKKMMMIFGDKVFLCTPGCGIWYVDQTCHYSTCFYLSSAAITGLVHYMWHWFFFFVT